VLPRAGLVALVVAYPFAVIMGPWQGGAVLAAAGLAMGNYLLMTFRLGGSSKVLARPGAPTPSAMTAKTMAGTGIRWLLTFFLVWSLLKRAEPLAVVAGLSCVVAAIALQAMSEYLRTRRGPPAGADT